MGMKSRSAYFSGAGAGGPSSRIGSLKFGLNIQFFAKMPSERSQIMHIMAEREGHLMDTPTNRKKLERISSNEKNYICTNWYGNRVYAKVIKGKQYWVYTRNGIIQDGGVNEPGKHRDFKVSMFTRKEKQK